MERRAVITGMGTINPLGDTLEGYYQNLIKGTSGIRRWQTLDMSNIECKIGGDLGDYDCLAALSRYQEILGAEAYKKIKKLFRITTFSAKAAMLCALAAWQDAGLFGASLDPYRTSVIVGGHNLNSNYIHENSKRFLVDEESIDPLSGVEAIDPNVPALITEILGLHGPTMTVGGACASGNLALREAFRDIKTGESDAAVVAGGLFDMSPGDIQASVIINAVVVKPEYQDNPEKASRPFDADRAGFVYSHGAGTLLLEELEHARARGAQIYGEVLGVKANANACHLPAPAAETQGRLISELLSATGTDPRDVDFASCHATGTAGGDLEEIRAIKQAFGGHAYNMKLNAAKSMLGHTCWASPIVETIAGLLQMKHGRLHPTTNIDHLDPEVDLDVCAGGPVEHRIGYMLKNSFGFGGINACSLIRRFEG
ncbi:MAG TPA: beta-ketoacyl-[acyl-carrier-protein] synthase family protein [Spirochaetia bacterium]|nr:beta-ketoacyl-[acyl-carrier-protein] synthase family protein [Spirochaetia bacterium]